MTLARIEPKMSLTTRYEPTNLEEALKLSALIAKSGLCPESLRGKETDVFMVLSKGSEMGLTSMQSLQNLYVIHGSIGCSADLLRARAQAHPDCVKFEIVEATKERAVLEVLKSGWTEPIKVTWALQDAQRAGLLRQGGSHERWPEEMHVARVTSRAARRYFPDVCAGLYVKEELESEQDKPEEKTVTPARKGKAAAIVAAIRAQSPLEAPEEPTPSADAPEPDRASEGVVEAEAQPVLDLTAERSHPELEGPLDGTISQDTVDEVIEEYMKARGVNAKQAEEQITAAVYKRYDVERLTDLPLVHLSTILSWAKTPTGKKRG